jgi:hypothetical protein
MSISEQVELERLRYWHGQRLRARDFRDQTAIEAQLRWWHNRALHNAFGVSLGLTVSPVPASGSLMAVRVTCGLAYDCFGRELILQDTREIPVPTAPPPQGNQPVATMTLLLRYKEAALFPQRNDLAAVCQPCAGAPFQEEPDFVWQPADRVQVTDGVPIARVNYSGEVSPEKFTVPISRALARPHLASGATLPEHTVWKPWLPDIGGVEREGPTIGVQTKIDTSAAGFTDIPCYFAWLQGAWVDEQGQPQLFPYFANIAKASPKEFTFRLLVAGLGEHERADAVVSAMLGAVRIQVRGAAKQRLYVSWLGCQMEHSPSTECL